MKIANKISLSFLAAGLILSVGAGSYVYNKAYLALKESVYSRLDIAAESRFEHINTYLNMLEISVGQLSKSVILEDFLIGSDTYPKEELYNLAEKRLRRTKEANPAIAEFILIDDKGKVVASSNKDSIGQDKSTDSLFLDGQKSVYIKDVYYSEMYNQPLLAVSDPILNSETNHFLGVLCARVKMDYLNSICINRIGMGETGEIYLVNKDGYIITPSRFIEGTVLKLNLPDYHPFKENTVNLYPDYRNIPVLGIHLTVPRMNWALVLEIDEAEAFAPLGKIRQFFVITLVLVLLISLLLSRIIASWIAKPISKLKKGAEIIGGGNLDYRTSIDSNDEVGQLSQAFDTMTENLKKSTISIDKLNEEITERKKAEAKIQFLLNEKEILLKEVHHRIKNNMMTISGMLMFQSNGLEDQRVKDALDAAQSRLQSMGALYDKLYRSDNFNEVSLKEYFEKLVDEVFVTLPESSHISIEKHIEDIAIPTKTSFSIGIIINELLSNIMKYAFKGRDKGTVTVSGSKKDDRVIIAVQDDGIGMPESVKINESKGFGLNLVDMMAKQINGTIQIENHNGTKFILEFPM